MVLAPIFPFGGHQVVIVFFGENGLDGFFRIVVRLGHACVEPGVQEAIDKSVILISVGKVGKVRIDDIGLDGHVGHPGGAGDDHEENHQVPHPVDLVFFSWAFDPKENDSSHQKDQAGDEKYNLNLGQVVCGDGHAFLEHHDVIHCERGHSLRHDDEVDDASR